MNFLKVLTALKIKGAEKIASGLEENCPKYGIITDEDKARFLANCLTESGGFTKYTEDLYYTTPARLKTIFKRAFNPIAYPKEGKYNPEEYLRNEEKLANLVYDDRIFNKKLGNTQDGDGFKYRGRGYIQVTGKNNYAMASLKTGVDFVNNPKLLADEEYRSIGALSYWETNKLSQKTSLLATRQAVTGINNSNPTGWAEVQEWYRKIKASI